MKTYRLVLIPITVCFTAFFIIMFAVPRTRYVKARDEHPLVRKPSKTVMAFYFCNHLITIIYLVLLLFVHPFIPTMICSLLIFVMYLLNVIFGIIYTLNPGKTNYPSYINEVVQKANTSELMGYVMIYGSKVIRKQKSRKTAYAYTNPCVFKVNATNFMAESLQIPNDRNVFGYELKFNSDYSTDSNISDSISHCRILANQIISTYGYKKIKYVEGFYPDLQGVNFYSTSGKLDGKYGQVARIFAAIFGVATYYDHTIASIPYYSSNISRTVKGAGEVKEPSFDLEVNLDLEMHYKELYELI